MGRGLRKATVPKYPEGVKAGTWVPILVIPSAGHSLRGDGSELSRRRPDGKKETEVRLRYQPCCDAHKAHINVPSLETPQELQALTLRLTQHHGHGRLLPDSAHIDWEKSTENVPCSDCLEEWEAKQAEAKSEARRA